VEAVGFASELPGGEQADNDQPEEANIEEFRFQHKAFSFQQLAVSGEWPAGSG
jgi:hypothetical protein